MSLIVNEIFYSLQGEGERSGSPSIFIRLTQCNLACKFCDTDFYSGEEMTVDQILDTIRGFQSRWIIWTGGEPTLQLTDEILQQFRENGYKQAIETNGTRKVSSLIDYVTCSPKQNFQAVKDLMPEVDEIRIPIKEGDSLPDLAIFPKAKNYFVSPIFDMNDINQANVDYCVELAKQNPEWRLSLQIHKLIHIQ